MTLADVLAQLRRVGGADEVALYVSSVGGSILEASRIHDALRVTGKRFAAVADGTVASAALRVWMVAVWRECSPSARFVLHGAASGDLRPGDRWTAQRHRERAQLIAAADQAEIEFLSRRLGVAARTIEAAMDAERVLDAAAALRLRLVHHVL